MDERQHCKNPRRKALVAASYLSLLNHFSCCYIPRVPFGQTSKTSRRGCNFRNSGIRNKIQSNSLGYSYSYQRTPTARLLHLDNTTTAEPHQQYLPIDSENCTPGKPYVEFIDPVTRCRVILLGCLHGSQSSADDVEQILTQSSSSSSSSRTTDAIVLELCASRYFSLERAMEQRARQSDQEKQRRMQQRGTDVNDTLFQDVQTYTNFVARTVEQKGISSGIAATIIGGASGLQTALSGFEPGLEFRKAIEYVKETPNCDIILADREVSETLRRVGQLPKLCAQFLHSVMVQRNFHLISTEYSNFQTALWGDQSTVASFGTQSQLDVGKVLVRNANVIRDMLQLTVPPLLAVSLGFYAAALAVDFFLADPNQWQSNDLSSVATLQLRDAVDAMSSFVADAIVNALAVSVGFAFVALPLTKVILTERDVHLARGVHDACRIVAARKNYDSSEEKDHETYLGVVVVILGLLHVNGVAKLLLSSTESSTLGKDEQRL